MVFFGLRKEGELEVQVPNAPKTALRFALSNPGSRGFPRYHVIVYQRSLRYSPVSRTVQADRHQNTFRQPQDYVSSRTALSANTESTFSFLPRSNGLRSRSR